MSKANNPPKAGLRLSSSVRIRRHHGSRLTNFLERHFGDGKVDEVLRPDSAQSNNTNENAAEPLRRPRLGTLDGEGRRTSGRSFSAVERLAAEDRASLRTASNAGQSTKSSAQTPSSRATDGHRSQLTRVSEDVSPNSGRGDSAAHYFDPIEENESDRFPTSIEGTGSLSKITSSSTSSAPPKGNSITDTSNSNQQSGDIRFLTPPRSDRSSTPEGEATSASPSNSRFRRNQAQVSIPTPVQEETVEMEEHYDDDHHTDDVADYLDVIDPEVGALGYLNNIGNSIFLPNIPSLYDRRPTHHLPSNRRRGFSLSSVVSQRRASATSSRSRRSQDSSGAMEEGAIESTETTEASKTSPTFAARPTMLHRVTSAVRWGKKDEDDDEFVKHIKDWRDMDEDERDELDEHVKMLLTKKSKFKRGAKGFYAFVKTPMGFIMTLYGFLVTFWGTAIILFIFGWIHVGHRKRYWIEICDQILCALFAAVGLGFAPFRAVDTYRMIHIAHYNRLTQRRRRELGLNELFDPNDLPRPEADGSNQVSKVEIRAEHRGSSFTRGTTFSNSTSFTDSRGSLLTPISTNSNHSQANSQQNKKHKKHLIHHKKILALPDEVHKIVETAQGDAEDPSGKTGNLSKGRNERPTPMKRNESIQSEIVKDQEDVVVLTEGEQAVLEHHQRKFHESHHYFRYHATSTHRAFPMDLMIVIVCLLDCHSLLQGALGGCTWGIKYTHRPTVLTATIITCSLSCNAVAGLVIYLGGRRTKKKEEVERRLRIALEQEALAKIERRRARGELPEREHFRKTPAEEKLAAHQDRDKIMKELGHLEGKSTSVKPTSTATNKNQNSNNVEMSAIGKTVSEK